MLATQTLRARFRRLGQIFLTLAGSIVLFNVSGAAASKTPTDATPPVEHLRRAFANRYDLSVTQRVRLIIRKAGAERRRVVEIATKIIGGRLHSLGRFTEPEYLRGTAILIIENRDRNNDHFVYQPSQKRVRRVSSAQRADAFMGTDFIYEDFERRYVEDYVLVPRGTSTVGVESVVVIAAKPLYDSAYRLAEFFVATLDYAILEVRYYQGPKEQPVKILRAPRSGMQIFEGHVLPTVMEMENRLRGTVSEARFDKIKVNPNLDDTLFTLSALEMERAIPMASPDPGA